MMLLGHVGLALIFSKIFGTNPLLTALGGILPDFDSIGFFLGIKWSKIHRKFTHSLLFLLIVGLLSLIASPFFAISIGVISHFIGDLDRWGIPLFYPFYKSEISIMRMDHSNDGGTPYDFLKKWVRSREMLIEAVLFLIGLLCL